MDIEALKARLEENELRIESQLLPVGTKEDIERLQRDFPATVFVIRDTALSGLTGCGDMVIRKGRKDDRVPLTRYFLGKKGVPVIDGGYGSAGKLKDGVRHFLERAVSHGDERNVYFLGASNEVFEDLARSAPQKSAVISVAIDETGCTPKPFPSGEPPLSTDPLFHLPWHKAVPKSLAEAYAGTSIETKRVHQMILLAAESRGPVLVIGDTGTGKGVVAYQIYALSTRRDRPFKALNCAAIPPDMFEAEIFGTVRGAFTGAVDRAGIMEVADGGTLFLDEIGEMSVECQAKLLRSIETGMVRRLGSINEREVDVKIILATNKDIEAMRKTGGFRDDFYYRITETLIRTPALSEHMEDMPAITRKIWAGIRGGLSLLPKEITEELMHRRWPGNVRELQTTLRRLDKFFQNKQTLTIDDLRMVFLYEGRMSVSRQPSEARQRLEALLNQIDSMEYLERVHKFVEATERVLTVIAEKDGECDEDGSLFKTAVKQRISDIEVLVSSPRKFSSYLPFNKVNELKSGLLFLDGLLEESGAKAAAFLIDQMLPSFQEIRSTITNEIATLRAVSLEAKDVPWR